MRKDFEKGKSAIWARWEKTLGKRIPPKARALIETDVEIIPGDEDVALNDLDGLIQEFFRKYEAFKEFEVMEYFSSRKKIRSSVSKKRYKRCFEKRLYLVEFIMRRRLTIDNWERRSFALRRRINWKQMCGEWNEVHPNDHMSPAGFKVRYYRAIAEEDIQREYFDKKDYEYQNWWQELFSELLKDIEEGRIPERPPEGLGNQSFESFESFESLMRFLLQHGDDFKGLVMKMSLDSFFDKLTNMTDSDKEALIKSWGIDNIETPYSREIVALLKSWPYSQESVAKLKSIIGR